MLFGFMPACYLAGNGEITTGERIMSTEKKNDNSHGAGSTEVHDGSGPLSKRTETQVRVVRKGKAGWKKLRAMAAQKSVVNYILAFLFTLEDLDQTVLEIMVSKTLVTEARKC
jgi:hypothetical protein